MGLKFDFDLFVSESSETTESRRSGPAAPLDQLCEV